MTYSVYAPSIHLFAFHLCKDAKPDSGNNYEDNYSPDLLWDKCNKEIFPKLDIKTDLKVVQKVSGSRVNLLKGQTPKNLSLPLEGEIKFNSSPVKVTGLAQPLRIHDSNALWLSIRRPQKENDQKTSPVDISILGELNPENCLLPSSIKSYFGQTLVITAWVTENINDKLFLRELADSCVQAFLNLPAEKCPPCRQEGQLFGSPLFEYGLVSQKEDYCHIIVWLFCQVRTDEKLEKCYQYLIDLFFYSNKIIQAYQNSRYVYYEQLISCYEKIEKEIYNFQSLPQGTGLTNKALNDLENQLKILPKTALEYAKWLRHLEEYQLTIKINARNYTETLDQIKSLLHNESLSFLETFTDKNCPYFQEQIQAYLDYSEHGLGLVSKAIAAIRGLVEIEQVRIERQRQEQEREN